MIEPGLPKGTLLGKYRIERLLDRGGMGEVYEAWDDSLRRRVALKVLPSTLIERPDRVERLIREARSASALNHPHIVTIYEVGRGEIGERPINFIAMEFLEGSTLRQMIETRRGSPKRLLALLLQVADALAKAHACGLIHRDLKPANIMVTTDGYAKLVDFGLAKLIEAGSSDDSVSNLSTASLSNQGALLGTVGYVAPEQLEHHSSDQRADIFSFGCILYEAITGRRAFEGKTAVDVLHKILHENPPAMASSNSTLPLGLQRIVDRCLEKDPGDRYDSMKDVLSDLREVERQVSTGSAELERPAGRRNPTARLRAAAAVAASLIVIAAIGVVGARSGRRAPPPLLTALATWPTDEYDCNFSPDGQWISFVSTRTGKPGLFLRRRAGGEAMLLSDRPATIRSHVWSPASDRIAYLSVSEGVPYLQIIPAFGGSSRDSTQLPEGFRNGRAVRWIADGIYLESDGLWLLDLETRRVTRLLSARTESGRRSWFHVRRDGKRIVFQLTAGNRSAVWVAGPHGADAVPLAPPDAPYGDYAPRFGGEGDGEILFSSDRGGQVDVWRQPARGGAPEQVTFSATAEWVEDVSPDGRFMAFLESRRDSHLWTVNPESGATRQLTADALQDRWPSTSRGAKIAFQRTRPSLRGGSDVLEGDIFVADLVGGELRSERAVVVDAGLPRISPDGRWVSYVRGGLRGSYEFWVKNLVTEHQWRISPSFRMPSLYPFPTAWLESTAAWSPSSGEIFLVTRNAERQGIVGADVATHQVRWIVPEAGSHTFRDLHISEDRGSLVFVRTSAGDRKRSEVVVHALATGRESVLLSTAHGWQTRIYCRGWARDGSLLVVVGEVNADDWTERVRAIRIGPNGEQRAASVAPRAFGGASLYHLPTDSLLFTAAGNDGFHNIESAGVEGGRARRLTNNTLPGVSFAAFEILAGNEVLLSRQEQNDDLWLIEFGR